MDNLVNYSSSEDEEETFVKPEVSKQPVASSNPRKTKLPMLLPVESKKSRISDNQEEHQNRVRSVPHIEGNWASHVYIECPLTETVSSALTRLTETFNELHKIESPHVSLSKTFILRYHWIDNFFSSLRETFEHSSQRFLLQFSPDVVYFSNEEKTRHFACVVVDESCREIFISFIKKVDTCLKEFNLPTYYDNPSFHISVLWKLAEFTEEEKSQVSLQVCSLMHRESYEVDRISIKTGNKQKEIFL